MCCICVFKQKTAYEMRISDWSSDVCSSDLALSIACHGTYPAEPLWCTEKHLAFPPWAGSWYILPGSRYPMWFLLSFPYILFNNYPAKEVSPQDQSEERPDLFPQAGKHILKLGRASGRERVCQ